MKGQSKNPYYNVATIINSLTRNESSEDQ